RNWNDLYENNRSRTVENPRWVAIPNKHDGETFTEIISHKEGAKIYAAFILMVQVASKCRPRGVLIKGDGTPHTPPSLSLKTRAPENWFILALEYLEKFTDWLDIQEVAGGCQSDCQSDCQAGARERNGIEGKGREGNILSGKPDDGGGDGKILPETNARIALH